MQPNAFIFGAQYYRAPTPSRENWARDLRSMREHGLNSVKFWVQWRWAHRSETEFDFSDIDELMDLAAENHLRVSLNVIFDVAPLWLYERYPEAKMVTADGEVIEPRAVGHRQIGGFPGPCYNHKTAAQLRLRFLEETVKRYASHPALEMWDVWNEPEQCGIYRKPRYEKLTCYCPACRAAFIGAMQEKYGDLTVLNRVWGKCYDRWDQLELPRNGSTFADFIDYREFMLDTLTAEANRRIETARKADPRHMVMLHVVPNTATEFSSLTGADDFALAQNGDVFASTNFAKPIWSVLTYSAARGKLCFNAECHIGGGNTALHRRPVGEAELVRDLVPQIGMGLRGVLFWQYRPELLGFEAPAWGMTALDGGEADIQRAAQRFIAKLAPYTEQLMQAPPVRAEVALWKSRKNEIFQFCIKEKLTSLSQTYEAYVEALYEQNYNVRIVDDEDLIEGRLDGIKLLILPQSYAMTQAVADAVQAALLAGISVLCEAHTGGYEVSTGRHATQLPGCGLAQRWGVRETYTTASYYLENSAASETADLSAASGDVKKAVDAYGLSGGKYFPLTLSNGEILCGAERFAALTGTDLEVWGRFGTEACLVRKKIGRGTLYYSGTDLGEGAQGDRDAFERFLLRVLQTEGVQPNGGLTPPRGVHIDVISDGLTAVNNITEKPYRLPLAGPACAVFSGTKDDRAIEVAPGCAELIVGPVGEM